MCLDTLPTGGYLKNPFNRNSKGTMRDFFFFHLEEKIDLKLEKGKQMSSLKEKLIL